MADSDDIGIDIDASVDDIISGVLPPSTTDVPKDRTLDKEPAPPADKAAPPADPAPKAAPAQKAALNPPADTIPYPKSWKQDFAPEWPKLPRTLQEYISTVREKDYLDGLEQYKTGHQSWQQMHETILPYQARLNSLGITPVQAVQHLLNAEHILATGSPDDKIRAIRTLAKDYGIDLAAAIQAAQTEANMSPEMKAMMQKYDGLESGLRSFMSQQVSAQRAVIDKDVATFAADPAHPYFEEVGDHIARLLKADAKLSLADAYEQAVWANPVTRAKEQTRLANEKESVDRKAREEAAKKARQARAANARGVQTSREATPPAGTIDDTLRETLADIHSRT
jgi:hypothetical protein